MTEDYAALLRQAADALVEVGKKALVVQPVLSTPYPDAPGWTPWTRFLESPAREAYNLGHALLRKLDGKPSVDSYHTGNVFLQYKGTDICVDLYCTCGDQFHYDGYFATWLRCPHCRKVWELPHLLLCTDVTGVVDEDRVKDGEADDEEDEAPWSTLPTT